MHNPGMFKSDEKTNLIISYQISDSECFLTSSRMLNIAIYSAQEFQDIFLPTGASDIFCVVEALYNKLNQDMSRTNDPNEIEELRHGYAVKFEFKMEGLLNGKEMNKKMEKLSDFISFIDGYGIAYDNKIKKILDCSEEKDNLLQFYPEKFRHTCSLV